MIEVIGYAFPNDYHIVWSLMIVTEAVPAIRSR